MGALTAAWDRSWFTEADTAPLAVVRCLVGGTVVVMGLCWAVDLDPLFLDERLATPASGTLGSLLIIGGSVGLWVTWTVLVSAGGLLTLGRMVAVAAPAAWLSLLAIQARNPVIRNGGDILLALLLLFLSVAALGGEARALSRRPDVAGSGAAWPIRLIQVQMTAIYLAAGLGKLFSVPWRDGTAISQILVTTEARFDATGTLFVDPLVGRTLTWGTLSIELALPVLLWAPRTRRLALLLGAVLHLSIELTMNVHFITPVMLCGLASFLRSEDLVGIRRLVRCVRRPSGLGCPRPTDMIAAGKKLHSPG